MGVCGFYPSCDAHSASDTSLDTRSGEDEPARLSCNRNDIWCRLVRRSSPQQHPLNVAPSRPSQRTSVWIVVCCIIAILSHTHTHKVGMPIYFCAALTRHRRERALEPSSNVFQMCTQSVCSIRRAAVKPHNINLWAHRRQPTL